MNLNCFMIVHIFKDKYKVGGGGVDRSSLNLLVSYYSYSVWMQLGLSQSPQSSAVL